MSEIAKKGVGTSTLYSTSLNLTANSNNFTFYTATQCRDVAVNYYDYIINVPNDIDYSTFNASNFTIYATTHIPTWAWSPAFYFTIQTYDKNKVLVDEETLLIGSLSIQKTNTAPNPITFNVSSATINLPKLYASKSPYTLRLSAKNTYEQTYNHCNEYWNYSIASTYIQYNNSSITISSSDTPEVCCNNFLNNGDMSGCNEHLLNGDACYLIGQNKNTCIDDLLKYGDFSEPHCDKFLTKGLLNLLNPILIMNIIRNPTTYSTFFSKYSNIEAVKNLEKEYKEIELLNLQINNIENDIQKKTQERDNKFLEYKLEVDNQNNKITQLMTDHNNAILAARNSESDRAKKEETEFKKKMNEYVNQQMALAKQKEDKIKKEIETIQKSIEVAQKNSITKKLENQKQLEKDKLNMLLNLQKQLTEIQFEHTDIMKKKEEEHKKKLEDIKKENENERIKLNKQYEEEKKEVEQTIKKLNQRLELIKLQYTNDITELNNKKIEQENILKQKLKSLELLLKETEENARKQILKIKSVLGDKKDKISQNLSTKLDSYIDTYNKNKNKINNNFELEIDKNKKEFARIVEEDKKAINIKIDNIKSSNDKLIKELEEIKEKYNKVSEEQNKRINNLITKNNEEYTKLIQNYEQKSQEKKNELRNIVNKLEDERINKINNAQNNYLKQLNNLNDYVKEERKNNEIMRDKFLGNLKNYLEKAQNKKLDMIKEKNANISKNFSQLYNDYQEVIRNVNASINELKNKGKQIEFEIKRLNDEMEEAKKDYDNNIQMIESDFLNIGTILNNKNIELNNYEDILKKINEEKIDINNLLKLNIGKNNSNSMVFITGLIILLGLIIGIFSFINYKK